MAEQESVSTRAELSEEASITKIQAHARGSQVRKRGSIKDLVLKLTPSKMGAESVTKETSGLGALTASALARPVKAAAAVSEELRADVGEMNRKVTKALENHLEFSFLASDTHPMYGLQDWSTAEWATKIEQHPELSALLAQTLQLNVGHDGSTPRDPCDLALELKKALALTQLFPDPDTPTLTAFRVQSYSQDTIGKPAITLILALILAPTGSLALTNQALREAQPLSRWQSVVAYQNACLNASHELDDDLEAFYMSPELLSNALFRRDFPLGVDKRIAQYRWRFAVENSGWLTLGLTLTRPGPVNFQP